MIIRRSSTTCRPPRPRTTLRIFFEDEQRRGLGQGLVLAPQLPLELVDPLLLGRRAALCLRRPWLTPSASAVAVRHCSSCSRCSPSRRSNAPSSSSGSSAASITTRSFSSIVQSCVRLGVLLLTLVTLVLLLLTGSKVPASRSHRDSVGCEIPVSSAKAVAVTARGPVIRLIILAFITSEYSIVFSLRAPRSSTAQLVHPPLVHSLSRLSTGCESPRTPLGSVVARCAGGHANDGELRRRRLLLYGSGFQEQAATTLTQGAWARPRPESLAARSQEVEAATRQTRLDTRARTSLQRAPGSCGSGTPTSPLSPRSLGTGHRTQRLRDAPRKQGGVDRHPGAHTSGRLGSDCFDIQVSSALRMIPDGQPRGVQRERDCAIFAGVRGSA